MGAQVGQAEDAPRGFPASFPGGPYYRPQRPTYPCIHQRPIRGHRHNPLIACPQSWELGTATPHPLPAQLVETGQSITSTPTSSL